MTDETQHTNAPRTEGHSSLARLRIDLAYDGGPFHGFARQPGLPTVQGDLERVLAQQFGHHVDLTCAGRTDAGVHALAQVVHVDVPDTPRATRAMARFRDDPAVFRLSLNRGTDAAIMVWQVTAVDRSFDARFSATERRYRYVLHDGPTFDPRDRHVLWHVREPLDVDAMHVGAQALVGDHDFATFCRLAPGGHTRRALRQCDVVRGDADRVHVLLRGPAFCHQLCRAVVGCLVEVGLGKQRPEWIGEILAAGDRSLAAPVARPDGLTLEGVGYPDPWPDAPLAAGSTTSTS